MELVQETETVEAPRMSSGEALAEILAKVTHIEAMMEHFEDIAETLVEQVQEVAASGLGSMLGGLVGAPNGNSEHSQDPS